jgi:hypothetical protein
MRLFQSKRADAAPRRFRNAAAVLCALGLCSAGAAADGDSGAAAGTGGPEPFFPRWSFGIEHSAFDWDVREYDNVWLLSRNYPGQGMEDAYLNRSARIEATFLTAACRLADTVELTLKAGVMKGGEEETNSDPGEYDPEPAWGIGVSGMLWETAGRSVRIEGGFHYHRGASSDWVRNNVPYHGDIETWGLDLLGAWTLGRAAARVSLLAGLSYLDLQLPYWHDTDPGFPDRQGGYEAEDRFGGAVGIELKMSGIVSVRGLQRFGPAEGASIAAAFTF